MSLGSDQSSVGRPLARGLRDDSQWGTQVVRKQGMYIQGFLLYSLLGLRRCF